MVKPQPGLSYFSEDLAFVKVDEKYGYVDGTGRMVIEPRFDLASEFFGGLAAVMVGEKWGYIDRTGKIAIAPQFAEAHSFVNGLASVCVGGRWIPGSTGTNDYQEPIHDRTYAATLYIA